jgi:hypothetical protein
MTSTISNIQEEVLRAVSREFVNGLLPGTQSSAFSCPRISLARLPDCLQASPQFLQTSPSTPSVCKPEIQPLSTFILSRRNTLDSLLRRHSVPNNISPLIPLHVVQLDKIKQHDVKAADTQQNLIPSPI